MVRKGGYLLAVHLPNLLIQSQKPQSQLGDMKIICPEPVWTVLDAERCQKKNLRMNYVEKPPLKKSAESLQNKILGTLGVKT